MRALRAVGFAVTGVGLLAAVVVALAGPFSWLRDLRHPLLVATLGYLLASAGSRSWIFRARIERILLHRRFSLALTAIAAFVFTRIKLLEWWSGAISGVDFSHLDYAVWSTVHGRFMEIPILLEHPTFTDMFGNHYSPVLFVSVAARALWDSPVASLVVHALSLALPIPILHRLALSLSDRASASLLTLVYVFCGAVASTLQFDTHFESFYVLGFGLIFLGALESLPCLLAGFVLSLGIKEDAGLYVAALMAILAWRFPTRRWLYAGLALVALAWLAFAVKIGMRAHQPPVLDTPAFYFFFWQRYGANYGEVARTMLTHPHWVLRDLLLNPALYKNLLPWGFVPLIAPFGLAALAPALVLSTASAMQRAFGLYYGIVLVPIFFAAAAQALGKFRTEKIRRRIVWAMLAVSVFVGGSFLRFPQPSPEFARWRALDATVSRFAPAPEVVAVQSGLLPFLPYETRWRRIETIGSLPAAGQMPLVFDRYAKGDSIEFPWEQLEPKLTAKGYRKIFDDGKAMIFR